MNIPDVDTSPDSLRKDPAQVRIDTGNANRVVEKNPVKQEYLADRADEYVQPIRNTIEERPDEYVRTPMRVISNALYDVSDIRNNRIEGISARNQGGKTLPSGERVEHKVLDIILSTGRKNLRIYRSEE